MICIRKENGKTTTHAICDTCGTGNLWECNISISRTEQFLRAYGWKIGKQHLCKTCTDGTAGKIRAMLDVQFGDCE